MSSPQNSQISKTRAWILATRPKTLPAAASPVLVGTAVAFVDHNMKLIPALIALAGGLLLQIGANLANDLFDYQKGADSQGRMGPLRVTQEGLLSTRQVLTGMWISFILAALCGIYLTLVSGWIIVLIGVLAILAAIAYSGGPFAYGYKGLGEFFVFIFFGFVAVCGTYYVQTNTISHLAIFSSIPVGLFVVAILVVNNLRDIESDRASGKQTMAVRKGDLWAKQEFIGLLAFAYLVVFLLGFSNLASPWILLSWISLPAIFPLSRSVINDRGRELNKTLTATGQITFIFSLLYAAGLVLSVYFPL